MTAITAGDLRYQILEMTKETSSRIELRFFGALLSELATWNGYQVLIAAWPPHGQPRMFSFGAPAMRQFRVDLQKPVGPYRTDLVLSREGVEIHVETDGHQFHEKTKEQARHDKKRDRFYVAQGLPVLRFTGSEVFESPENCVAEVLQVLEAKTREAAHDPV